MKATFSQHPRVLENVHIEAMAARRTQARTEIYRICSGERRWTMSIPVQMDDSDHLLCYVIEDAENLEREVYRLRGAVKRLAIETEMPDEVRQALFAVLFGTGDEVAADAFTESES